MSCQSVSLENVNVFLSIESQALPKPSPTLSQTLPQPLSTPPPPSQTTKNPFEKHHQCSGLFKGGGNGRGGISHRCERYNVCLQWCRDTRTVTRVRHHLLCLLREDQNLRNNCVTVPRRRAGRRASPYRHPRRHAKFNVVPQG